MSKIPTLKQMYRDLGCREKTVDGVCWFECNTGADKVMVVSHGVTGGKVDLVPLCKKYVELGFAVYAVDLPGHGGSAMPEVDDYDDLTSWLVKVLRAIGRRPDAIIGNSFSSSIVYHALRTGKISKSTKIVMACPTPDQSRLADVLQALSSYLPSKFAWEVYNTKPIRRIRMASALKTRPRPKDAWAWLAESEGDKKSTLALKDSNALTTLLYKKNPYIKGVPNDYDITVIIGGRDNIITPKTRDIMKNLLPSATFVIAPSAGHILHFEAVDSYPKF